MNKLLIFVVWVFLGCVVIVLIVMFEVNSIKCSLLFNVVNFEFSFLFV